MGFRIAVCDAEHLARTATQSFCAEYFAAWPGGCTVKLFSDGTELLAAAVRGERFDLYLLDVQPRRPNGIDTAKQLRGMGVCSPVVFQAACRDYAYEAYRVDALQYLLRPVSRRELFETLDRAVEPQHGPIFPVSTPYGLRGISYSDIVYVECTDHVLHFHRADGSVLRSVSQRIPFAQAAAPLLADARFLQPHRSYIINLDRVQSLNKNSFVLENGAKIPVPREKYAALYERFEAYLAR